MMSETVHMHQLLQCIMCVYVGRGLVVLASMCVDEIEFIRSAVNISIYVIKTLHRPFASSFTYDLEI